MTTNIKVDALKSIGRQMYIFEGIDEQKTIDDAKVKSLEGPVLVHYHRHSEKCDHAEHVFFSGGVACDVP